MRNVAFHVDSTIVLDIRFARGRLRRAAAEHPAYPRRQAILHAELDSARIAITPAALGELLNRYTFAYPGSPLRKLVMTIDHGQIRQHGTLRGISFDLVGDLSLTPEGDLRTPPDHGQGGRGSRSVA